MTMKISELSQLILLHIQNKLFAVERQLLCLTQTDNVFIMFQTRLTLWVRVILHLFHQPVQLGQDKLGDAKVAA